MGYSSEHRTLSAGQHADRATRTIPDVRLEPLPDLEWSLATESEPLAEGAVAPASIRRGWVHCADQERVLLLFRRLSVSTRRLPAPWWLTALDRGDLPSREAAFAIEDEVHALLTSRRGWVFVPWGSAGESGYWEYGPSDREPVSMPTTVAMTDRHRGWVHVVPAHADAAGALPVPVDGVTGLSAVLPEVESW